MAKTPRNSPPVDLCGKFLQALAAEYDVRFIEASAKADVNVTEAFQAIAQQVIDRIPRGMSRPASRQLSSKKSSKKSCSC